MSTLERLAKNDQGLKTALDHLNAVIAGGNNPLQEVGALSGYLAAMMWRDEITVGEFGELTREASALAWPDVEVSA